jgi:hypothetical protein
MFASIFLDFTLPNAATWFYFSFLLVLAIFCQWNRRFTLVNWDLFALFLIVPGLLSLQEAHALKALANNPDLNLDVDRLLNRSSRMLWVGYIWLMSASAFWFFRCLADLALEQRSPFHSNLNVCGPVYSGDPQITRYACPSGSRTCCPVTRQRRGHDDCELPARDRGPE